MKITFQVELEIDHLREDARFDEERYQGMKASLSAWIVSALSLYKGAAPFAITKIRAVWTPTLRQS